MDTAVFVLRVALAAVFVTAAMGKLADLRGARAALAGFGVPAGIAAVGATLVPAAELAVAAALIPAASAPWGAVGALVLLAAFIGSIARALSQGRTPDCHCFGSIHSTRVGWGSLVQNLVLALAAATILWSGQGWSS